MYTLEQQRRSASYKGRVTFSLYVKLHFSHFICARKHTCQRREKGKIKRFLSAEQMLGADSSDVAHAISTQSVRARINSTIRHNNNRLVFLSILCQPLLPLSPLHIIMQVFFLKKSPSLNRHLESHSNKKYFLHLFTLQ